MSNTNKQINFTDDEIKNLTIKQISSLTIEQINALSSEHIRILEEKYGYTEIYFFIHIFK